MSSATDLNIANGIREQGSVRKNDIAVLDRGRALTFGELDERSSRVANALLERELPPRSRVAVLLGNRLEFFEIAAGIAKAGLVMVPINPRLTGAEADYIVRHSGATSLILDDALAPLVETVVGDSALRFSLALDGAESAPPYEQALERARATDPRVPTGEREPFTVSYTSGTTARPKGVEISHRSRTLTFYCSALEWRLGPDRHSVAVAPLYHGAGFAFAYAALVTGGSVSVLRSWDPEEFLQIVQDARAQTAFLVPTHAQMLRAFDSSLSSKDLSSLDTLFFNAAPFPFALKEWVLETLPRVDLHEVYGSTEAGVVTNLRPPDQRRKPGSVGKAWFMTELRVAGDAGEEIAAEGIGEICARSPFLMNGYLDDPETTAARTTPDGFFLTGDVARVDDEGYLYIVDRKSDLIISGGVNVYPREIEEILVTHPAVGEVAVVGMPSELWGEEITAFVVAAGGKPVDERELDAYCRGRLAAFKLPRTYRVVASLPRNTAGKILKRELRDGAIPV